MLLEIMNREMRIIEFRRQLVRSEDYSSRGALVAIDGNDHRWVCSQDLFKFLKNYGMEVGLRQVEKLMEAINYNLDGRISEQQLAWVLEGF
jgi:Ca2+-binding EF-hand superfamily protein